MKKLKLLFSVMFLCGIASAQDQIFHCAEMLNVSQQVTDFRYEKYNENYIVRKYDSFSQVVNSTEEELMRSVLSASDLNWYNFNLEEKVKETSQDFNYIKMASADAYYSTLVSKVNFIANGTEYAVVKYHLHYNGEIYGFAEAMKKNDNKWVTTKDYQVSQLLLFMGMVDITYIDAIVNNKQTDNAELNRIIGENTKNNNLDLNAIIFSLQKGLDQNDKLTSILDTYRIFK